MNGVCRTELFVLGTRIGNLEVELIHDYYEAGESLELLGSAINRVERKCGINLKKEIALADKIEKLYEEEEDYERARDLSVELYDAIIEKLPRREPLQRR